MSKNIQIHCNCPTQEVANSIASTLVELKLAACVNILPQIGSVYRWQGKVEQETEFQLQIKTTMELYQAIEDKLIALHPYDVPEIIALPIVCGHQPYLDWIEENTNAL